MQHGQCNARCEERQCIAQVSRFVAVDHGNRHQGAKSLKQNARPLDRADGSLADTNALASGIQRQSRAPTEAPLAIINLSVVMQAADSPGLRLAAAAALPCGQSCALRGWCTRVLQQVWQAKECASALAVSPFVSASLLALGIRYCTCQLVSVCRPLIAAFRWAGVISFSKPFLASRKVGHLPRGLWSRQD
jgi:hypothetical protein